MATVASIYQPIKKIASSKATIYKNSKSEIEKADKITKKAVPKANPIATEQETESKEKEKTADAENQEYQLKKAIKTKKFD